MAKATKKLRRSVPYSKGDRVRILTSNRDEDPNTYMVEGEDRNRVFLRNGSTQAEIKVHKSRVIVNLDAAEQETTKVMSDNATKTNEKKTKSEASSTTVKKKSAPKRIKFDIKAFAAWLGNDCEHYSKKTNFDYDHLDVRAHVVITGDHSKFVTFNTYDGSLGRRVDPTADDFDNSQVGKTYKLADDAAYTKKIEKLKKQGYTKRPL
jgi:aspartate 1-decarboxylase